MSPIGLGHAATVVRLMKLSPQWLGDGYTYNSQNPVQLLSDFQP